MAERHRGIFVGAWIAPELAEKLAGMARASGLNRSQVLTRLIAGRKIPDQSYMKTLSYLMKLGGLLKHKAEGREEIFKLGQNLITIARSLQSKALGKDEPCPPL